jgi:hypothetical protein
LIIVVIGALLSSCGSENGSGREPQNGGSEQAAVASAEEDVAALGREIFDLVDRAMAYRSAHRGRLPRNLRELGIDELTPTTSRSLAVDGNVPTVTVTFRAPHRHSVSNCRGTSAILEEATLAGGTFSLICNLLAGGTATLKAAR